MISCQVIGKIACVIQKTKLATVTSCREPEPESEPEPTCGLIKIIEAINELQYYIDIEQLEDWQQEATIVYIEQYGCGERNAQGTVSWLDTSQFVATDEEEEAAEDDAAEEEAEEAEEADEE